MGAIKEIPETKIYNGISLGISIFGPWIFIQILGYKEYGFIITKTV